MRTAISIQLQWINISNSGAASVTASPLADCPWVDLGPIFCPFFCIQKNIMIVNCGPKGAENLQSTCLYKQRSTGLLEQAGQRFRDVLAQDEHDVRAMNNWGRVLCVRAGLTSSPQAGLLLAHTACSYFQSPHCIFVGGTAGSLGDVCALECATVLYRACQMRVRYSSRHTDGSASSSCNNC